MKAARRIAELSRAVLARGEPEDCLQLLRLCDRLGVGEAQAHLTGVPARALLAAWRVAPAARDLAPRLLPLLGWETVPRGDRAPGSWWAEAGRLGEDGDHDYDTATGLPLYVRVVRTGALLARVPAGSLSPAHARQVELDGVGDAAVGTGFWMGVREVTVGEYREVMGQESLRGNPYATEEDAPMRYVSWLEAIRFCRTLDDFDGGPVPVIYRLPRVLEWELALEVGGQWGRAPRPGEAVLEYGDSRPRAPGPPGQRPPNALGIEDLVGNVGELALERTGFDPDLPRTWTCDQPVLPDQVVCDVEDLTHVADFLFYPRFSDPANESNLDRISRVLGAEAGRAFCDVLRRGPRVPVLGANFRDPAARLDSYLRQLDSAGGGNYTLGFRLVAAPASCLDCPIHR